ncbi:MAG: sporulation protein YqfD [Clostridia bacterium]
MILLIVKIILNHILGYVKIKVESVFIERFINICISKRIFIWDIQREKSSIMYANIGIKDFKRLKNVAKKTKSKVSIEGKYGIPFLLHRYRKRKNFFILCSIILISLVAMSRFVWNIEIEGLQTIPKEEFMQELNDYGLKIGTRKSLIDSNSIINKMRLTRDDISWMGIDIKGTNIIIKIKEKEKAPIVINKSDYCNIVSNKTGLITKINVQDGTKAVEIGDMVKEGDVLVLGLLEGKFSGETRYVHAIADVEAKVWYSKKEKFYYNQDIRKETGQIENKYSIKFNNFKINFTKTLSKFQNYDTICKSKKILLFPNFYLPIEIVKKTNIEYKKISKTFTEEELIEIATEKLEIEIEAEIENKDNIINKQINVDKQEEYVEVEIIYEVIEKIGIEEKIIL